MADEFVIECMPAVCSMHVNKFYRGVSLLLLCKCHNHNMQTFCYRVIQVEARGCSRAEELLAHS